MRIGNLKEALRICYEAKVTPLLIGDAGVGKTSETRRYNTSEGYATIVINLGNMDVGDLLGLADFSTDSQGNKIATKFMRPSWFPTDPKSKGVVFLDEINRASPFVLQAVFSLVLEGRIHDYHLPEGWRVVAAMNPNTEGYNVTSFEDIAFLSRFAQIKVVNTASDFAIYANAKQMLPTLTTFIAENFELVNKQTDFKIKVTPNGRSVELVNSILKISGDEDVKRELVEGLLGFEPTALYYKFLENELNKSISANDVMYGYQQIKDKIKKYSEEYRTDIITKAVENLITELEIDSVKEKDKRTHVTKEVGLNIIEFACDLPKDIFAGCMSKLLPLAEVPVTEVYKDENDPRVKEVTARLKTVSREVFNYSA